MKLQNSYFNILIYVVFALFLQAIPRLENVNLFRVETLVSAVFLILLFYMLNNTNSDTFSIRFKSIFWFSAAFFTLAALTSNVNNYSQKLYKLVTFLGGGTVTRENTIIYFSDLQHLTSAARCGGIFRVGNLLCDPLGRSYNQFPYIVKFLKQIHLTEFRIIGCTLIFFTTWLLIKLAESQKLSRIHFAIIFFNPILFLAFERNNELLSLIFILLAVIFYQQKNKQSHYLAILFLIFASIIKLWPFIFLTFLSLHKSMKSHPILKFYVFLTGLFFLGNLLTIKEMLKYTNYGNSGGYSFGLSLLPLNSYPKLFGTFTFSITVVLILSSYLTLSSKSILCKHSDERIKGLVSSLLLTYSVIFVFSTSWSYRLIVLLPLLILIASRCSNGCKTSNLTNIFFCLSVTSFLSLRTPLHNYFLFSIFLISFSLLLSNILGNFLKKLWISDAF